MLQSRKVKKTIFEGELLPSRIMNEHGNAIEEIVNSVTHGFGAGFAVAAMVVLLVLSGRDPWKVTSFAIYGASTILLFAASALVRYP